MADKIELEIVSPERRVIAEEVDEVVLPSENGYLGVRPGHAPLLCRLTIGQVSFRQGDKERVTAISGGFAEILAGRVSILAETAERASEIDADRAASAKDRAEPRSRLDQSDWDYTRARIALEKALNRISARNRAGL